jgi:hypothetical protein
MELFQESHVADCRDANFSNHGSRGSNALPVRFPLERSNAIAFGNETISLLMLGFENSPTGGRKRTGA